MTKPCLVDGLVPLMSAHVVMPALVMVLMQHLHEHCRWEPTRANRYLCVHLLRIHLQLEALNHPTAGWNMQVRG